MAIQVSFSRLIEEGRVPAILLVINVLLCTVALVVYLFWGPREMAAQVLGLLGDSTKFSVPALSLLLGWRTWVARNGNGNGNGLPSVQKLDANPPT